VKYSDSQELSGENGRATNAIDDARTTIWHTKWSGGSDPLPHELQLDLGSSRAVTAVTYLPRQDGGANGRIGRYEIYVSADGSTWGTAVAAGTFADDARFKVVNFPLKSGRYVRVRALTEAGNRGPWTSAAEFTVLGS